MLRCTGIKGFYRGFSATIGRDSLFGGVYTSSRLLFISSWNGDRSKVQHSNEEGGPPADLLLLQQQQQPQGKEGDAPAAAKRETVINVFAVNAAAACIAVLASSPLNYVRNVQLAAPTHAEAPCMRSVLRGLWGTSPAAAASASAAAAAANINNNSSSSSSSSSCRAIFRRLSSRLLWGWGTMRAASGMAFGSVVYDLCTRISVHTPETNNS